MPEEVDLRRTNHTIHWNGAPNSDVPSNAAMAMAADEMSSYLDDIEGDAAEALKIVHTDGAGKDAEVASSSTEIGNSSNKRQHVTKPLPPMDAGLIEKSITIESSNGGQYKCYVMGCLTKDGITKHKVMYVKDESTETIELANRTWSIGKTNQLLVCKRIYVYKSADSDAQKKAADAKVPYEAFVFKFLGPNKYRLLS